MEQLQDVNKLSDEKINAKAQAHKSGFMTLSSARNILSYLVLILAASFLDPEDDCFLKMKMCTRNGLALMWVLQKQSWTKLPCGS
jgi:hypothetical protein